MPTKTTSKPKKTVSKRATPAPEAPAAPQEPATSPIDADPQDNALQMVLKTQVTLDDTSLKLLDNTTFEQWQEVYAFAEKLNERGKWWLGDIIRFAEGKFPDRYTQAVEITALSYSRLTTIVSVCGRIDPARRRKEAKFSFHELIAYLPYQTGDHLLDRAIKEKWTHEQLADAVARSKGEPTKAERKAEKERQKGVKLLPNSANGAPPTLDGHLTLELQHAEKPLIWNGHPLSVAITPEGQRIILQGPEILTSEEADRAAHHHKHAHGPALAAWLEEHNFIKGGDEPCATPTNTSAPATLPSPGKAIPDALSTVASNGAAPNATESAPTPQLLPCPFCGGEVCRDFVNDEHHRDISCAQCGESFRMSDETWNSRPTAAPAAPPASPEPEIDTTAQIEDLRLRIEAQNETLLLAGQRQKELQVQLDDARDQLKRYDAHTDAQTPLQRAEEAITRFNEASKDVDWTEVGKNAARRAKWLGSESNRGLLTTSDEVIDALQSNPPAQRK